MATQRDYFEDRISVMFEAQILESLSKNPGLGQVTKDEAEQALGVRKLSVQLDDLKQRGRDLDKDIHLIDREIEAIVRRRFPDLEYSYRAVPDALQRVENELTDKALSKPPDGRRVLGLKSTLNELQDRLHLANNTNDYKAVMEEAEKALKL